MAGIVVVAGTNADALAARAMITGVDATLVLSDDLPRLLEATPKEQLGKTAFLYFGTGLRRDKSCGVMIVSSSICGQDHQSPPSAFVTWCDRRLEGFNPDMAPAHAIHQKMYDTAVRMFCDETVAQPAGTIPFEVARVCAAKQGPWTPDPATMDLLEINNIIGRSSDGHFLLKEPSTKVLISQVQVLGDYFHEYYGYNCHNIIFRGNAQSASSGYTMHANTGALVNRENDIFDFYSNMRAIGSTSYIAVLGITGLNMLDDFLHRCHAAAAVDVIAKALIREQQLSDAIAAPPQSIAAAAAPPAPRQAAATAIPPRQAAAAAAAAAPVPRQAAAAAPVPRQAAAASVTSQPEDDELPPPYSELPLPLHTTTAQAVRHVGSGQIGSVMQLTGTARHFSGTPANVTMNTGVIRVTGNGVGNQIWVNGEQVYRG